MDSISTALLAGPRYLASSWPWRAVAACLLAGVVSVVLLVGVVPALVVGVSSRLRGAVWSPLLELEAARLALVDAAVGARLRRGVSASRIEGRVPTARDIVHLLITAMVTGPIGVVGLVFLVLLDAVLLAAPVLVDNHDPIVLGPVTVQTPVQAWVSVGVGIVGLVVSAYLIGTYVGATVALAALIGTDTAGLRREVDRLADSRTALLRAVEHERRRIESELHDRVQHRLVALALTLGMAENRHGDDDTGRLAADAHGQLDSALAELRSVILGIAPRALTEFGLAAAITDLVGTYPLPVTCELGRTQVPTRLPHDVEQIAYLVVNEALTNVLKHAAATEVAITADRDDRVWWMSLSDNGVGGATTRVGRGLDMLSDRACAADGSVTVESPIGGPTTITLQCPLVSTSPR